ncbi:MAG: hypothetical protein H0U10_08495 [Chloroflexia bacterium]|nr:hypothetical protein [Chloroflexia bacterium]
MVSVVSSPEPAAADAPADAPRVEVVEAPPAAVPVRAIAEAGRRAVESFVIAALTSTGVYLVGSVYTDAYYGRMSIDAAALDLPVPFVALQAVHAVQNLLAYPVLLLVIYLLYRAVAARLPRARSWTGQPPRGLGWLALVVVNGLVVSPLILAAVAAGANRALIQTSSALSEVTSLMQFAGFVLVVYVLWLSLGPRRLIFAEIRQRRALPIALLAALFLLGALVNTAGRARADAERLMTGAADGSVAVAFTMATGEAPPPSADLVLVAIRNAQYFVVERQPDPPSRTPSAYAIPVSGVDAARLERVNPAAPASEGVVIQVFSTTSSP